MSEAIERRLCLACKWHRAPENQSLQCASKYFANTINPVDGSPAKVYCSVERAPYGRCGQGGAFWEKME